MVLIGIYLISELSGRRISHKCTAGLLGLNPCDR